MKIEEAREILEAIKLPKAQQNDMCCRVLLALSGIKEKTLWNKATDNHMRIHDIIKFIETNYDFKYAENSRETIRKQAIKPFIDYAIVEKNQKVTNSPLTSYRLTAEILELLRVYKTSLWKEELEIFLDQHEDIMNIMAQRKQVKKMEITINGEKASISAGVHNRLQKEILDEFAARFAHHGKVLYIGDTEEKYLYRDDDKLKQLKIEILNEDKLPDILIYREDKNWLYLIEAVTSVGPMTLNRMLELKKLCEKSDCGLIFVTAFRTFTTYKKFANQIAWDTEVWISENPDHMIHLNGDKFLGPRN